MDGKKASLVGGVAALAVIGWIVLRGGHDAPANPSRGRPAEGAAGAPVAGEPAGSATAAADDRVHPVHAPIRVPSSHDDSSPPPDAAPPAHPALANGFDAESRDDGWADEHEHELARRLAKVHVDGVALDKAECKSDQCRITFTAADDHALGTYLHKLESPDVLSGYAQMMVMEGITDTDDGKRQERVYARFAE